MGNLCVRIISLPLCMHERISSYTSLINSSREIVRVHTYNYRNHHTLGTQNPPSLTRHTPTNKQSAICVVMEPHTHTLSLSLSLSISRWRWRCIQEKLPCQALQYSDISAAFTAMTTGIRPTPLQLHSQVVSASWERLRSVTSWEQRWVGYGHFYV